MAKGVGRVKLGILPPKHCRGCQIYEKWETCKGCNYRGGIIKAGS